MAEKVKLPSENSKALRVMCCLMAITAISASFIFGESAVPTVQFSFMQGAILVLCIWLCIGGGVFSYHYREQLPPVVPTLIKVGAALIILNLARELWEANMAALQFQFLRPLMHALVAASVLTSFELRTRSDIISSATFGLLLLSVAAASGKSMLFGIFVFLYICFGAVLLIYSCLSQTRNESSGNGDKRKTTINQVTKGRTPLAAFLAMVLLPVVSVAAFSIMPRLDNEADSVNAHMRTVTTTAIYNMRRKQSSGGDGLLPRPNATFVKKVGPNRLKAARMREAARLKKEAEARGESQRQTLPDQTKPAPTPEKAPGASQTSPGQAEPGKKDPDKTQPGKTENPPQQASSSTDKPAQDKPPQDKSAQDKPAQNKPGDSKQGKKPAEKNGKPGKKPGKNVVQKPGEKESDVGPVPPLDGPGEEKPKPGTGKSGDKDKPGGMDDSSISMSEPVSNPEEALFTLSCTRSVYTKYSGMDHFDGQTWIKKGFDDKWYFQPSDKGVTFEECPPLAITYEQPIMEVAQEYTLENNLGFNVPIAGIPQHISLTRTMEVDALSTVRASQPLIKGTEYSVVAQLPVYSLDEMRKLDNGDIEEPLGIDGYLQIPEDQSEQLYQLSSELIGESGNRFTKAERILKYLRTNFKYASKPVPGKDPKANYVDTFLFETRHGDCKAFASAFILLCRASEIPARLAVGFLPGDFDPVTGAAHVKRKHGHAWAEAYIPPYGWVPFDATPTGMLPARPEENYYNAQRIAKEVESYSKQANSKGADILRTALTYFGYALGGVGLAVALFALYLAVRAGRGIWSSLARSIKQRHPATRIKQNVVRRLHKMGVTTSPADTGGDVVAKLERCLQNQGRDSELADKVADFMTCYNAVYFGQEKKMDELKSLEREVAKMCAAKRSQ